MFKKFISTILMLAVLVIGLAGCSYLPETGAVLDEAGALVLPSLDVFLAGVLQPLFAAFILVLVNFALGVLAAVLDKSFEWSHVGNYLGKYFLLNILGWLLAEFLVQIVPAIYPDLPEWIDAGMVLVLRASLFTSLIGSILEKGQFFGLWQTAFGGFLSKIGVPKDDPTPSGNAE